MYQSNEETDAIFNAWLANEADSRARRHARRAARPVRDRVVVHKDPVVADPERARAEKQGDVGHRLVSNFACYVLIGAIASLVLIAVFALPGTCWTAAELCGMRPT